MKKVLIISAHFVPSNLTAVHRARLFATNLPKYGWEPIVLTVDDKYYEEKPDHDLGSFLPTHLRIEKVNAFAVSKKIRMIGDIGLRAFLQLYKRAHRIIKEERIDILLIEIPSFYVSLLGRLLRFTTGIKFGVDYIDPWVHKFAGSEKLFSRHWLSTEAAKLLEPFAVKNASFITGVSEKYYEDVFRRNKNLYKTCISAAMPYGGEKRDHLIAAKNKRQAYLFQKNENEFQFVYAGAFLPQSKKLLECICKNIADNSKAYANVKFHFIGTGIKQNQVTEYSIRKIAEKYNLWQTKIYEYPERISYLDVLIHLNESDAVFILGTTEPHYSPSKIYQSLLARKPVFGVLHEKSQAIEVVQSINSVSILKVNEENYLDQCSAFTMQFKLFSDKLKMFSPTEVTEDFISRYSAEASTAKLVSVLNQVVG
jgi:hypothetical protein